MSTKTRSEREWRCRKCGILLGVEVGRLTRLSHQGFQWVVDGPDYLLVVACRSCGSLNERSPADRPLAESPDFPQSRDIPAGTRGPQTAGSSPAEVHR